ncbi:unnamed protein product [Ectocarpus sp. 13 AM-2016]
MLLGCITTADGSYQAARGCQRSNQSCVTVRTSYLVCASVRNRRAAFIYLLLHACASTGTATHHRPTHYTRHRDHSSCCTYLSLSLFVLGFTLPFSTAESNCCWGTEQLHTLSLQSLQTGGGGATPPDTYLASLYPGLREARLRKTKTPNYNTAADYTLRTHSRHSSA